MHTVSLITRKIYPPLRSSLMTLFQGLICQQPSLNLSVFGQTIATLHGNDAQNLFSLPRQSPPATSDQSFAWAETELGRDQWCQRIPLASLHPPKVTLPQALFSFLLAEREAGKLMCLANERDGGRGRGEKKNSPQISFTIGFNMLKLLSKVELCHRVCHTQTIKVPLLLLVRLLL